VVIMFCGFSLGSILGGGLTAALVSRVGWRPVFLVCGALPLLLAPILIGVLPESLPAHAPATGLPVTQLFHSGRALGTLLLWLVFFMNLMVFFFLQNWLPMVLTGSGLATETAVLVSTLISLGGIGAGLSTGPMMDRFGPYPVLAVLYICGTILVASIGYVSTSLPAIIAVTVGAGFSVSGGQKSVNALPVIFYRTTVRSNRRRLGARCRPDRLDCRPAPGRLDDRPWLVQHQHLRICIAAFVVRGGHRDRHGAALWFESRRVSER
jgi:AAHS family 4-hydroxybenzoate transporter-like MFS transporter